MKTGYNKIRTESLEQLANLTEHAGQELMQMFDDWANAPGCKYEFSAPTIYRISAMLRVISHELVEEANWYRLTDTKRGTNA